MDLPGIAFAEDDQHQLVMSFAPVADARAGVDVPQLRAHAAEKGYGGLAYDERSLGAAIVKIRRREACCVVIARRTDAEYRLDVASDKMTASLTVIAECGGKAADALSAVAALAAHNIRAGVDAGAVERAIANSGERHEVATGAAPRPGKDGSLEALVVVNRQRHPQIDASGHVDLHDLGAIPAVLADDALMRRHPAEPGVAGCDVFGAFVPPPPTKDVVFGSRLQGVAVSPHDPNVLIATIAGQPLLQRDGISVEPIVRYDDVDMSVGNVDFPGSIEVRGDICSGLKVRAGGDILVKGVIESADVAAGGDIKVVGGVIGHSLPPRETRHAASARTARICAQGHFSARFVENAVIEAKLSVRVAEFIVQSDITGLDQVTVGGEGKKGRILGGRVRATALVGADIVGGDGAAPTRVTVGIDPHLQQALDTQRERLEARLQEHDDLAKVAALLHGRADKKAVYDKALLTMKKLDDEIGAEMRSQRALQDEAKLADNAKIVIGERMYAGVTIVLGEHTRFINEDLGRGVFQLDTGGELTYGTLARTS